MRSHKRKQRKNKSYKQHGGDLFASLSTNLMDRINNNYIVKKFNDFFVQPTMPQATIQERLMNNINGIKDSVYGYKDTVYNSTKQKIQAKICNSGGSNRTLRKKNTKKYKKIKYKL